MYGRTNTVIKCCFGCKDRKLKCHSTCERYLAESKKHRQLVADYNDGKEIRGYTKASRLLVQDIIAKRRQKKMTVPINWGRK